MARVLDLFCGAGGATKGYQNAGYDVFGVDHKYFPNYPGTLLISDFRKIPMDFMESFDLIHASPPCQKFSSSRPMARKELAQYDDFVAETREILQAVGLPYVIENVEGAPLNDPIMLCGSMFDMPIERHRLFEIGGFDVLQPTCNHNRQKKLWPQGFPSNKKGRPNGRVVSVFGHGGGGPGRDIKLWSWAMGIDWMYKNELAQAIPPKYTEYIAHYFPLV